MVGHGRQPGEEFFEIGVWLEATIPGTFDEGVDDGAVCSSLPRSDEEPVFGAELCGSDGILDEVVVDFKTTVAQVSGEGGPLSKGVSDGSSHVAFGKVAVCLLPVIKDFFEPVKVGPALGCAKCLT